MNPVPRSILAFVKLRWASRYSTVASRPVLTIPVKLQNKLQRALAERQKAEKLENSREGNKNICIVSCKNSGLNHYLGKSYGTFDEVPLASRGWQHKKSAGDYFTILSHGKNPSVLSGDSTFEDLNLDKEIIQALRLTQIERPTLIQKLGIKPILRGENCLIAAETGSGKTLSYLAPILHLIKQQKANRDNVDLNSPLAVVLTPGRELAEQIGLVCRSLASHVGIEIITEIGGRLKKRVLQNQPKKIDVLVATLGAASKLTTTRIYDMGNVRHLVLDEADTLLDDTFSPRLLYLLKYFRLQTSKVEPVLGPSGAQVVMASATIPTSAEMILGEILPYSSFTRVTTDYLHRLLPHVPQRFLRLAHKDKAAKLLELVRKDVNNERSVIIFSGKSETSDWISLFLKDNNIESINLNGALSQRLREDRFQTYASGKVKVISCTDVVSRGLDTCGTHHVINFDMALNMSDYIHRCGRVGRVGTRHLTGHVTNFVCKLAEVQLTQKIEYAARKTNDTLPNVNANVRRLIESRLQSNAE